MQLFVIFLPFLIAFQLTFLKINNSFLEIHINTYYVHIKFCNSYIGMILLISDQGESKSQNDDMNVNDEPEGNFYQFYTS